MQILLSKDLEKYWKEKNISFSDFEKATMIYNHEDSLASIHEVLNRMKHSTSDQILITQIEERIKFDETTLNLIACDSADTMYMLEIEDEDTFEVDSYYKKYQCAKNYANTLGKRYRINKIRFSDTILQIADGDEKYGDIGSVLYNNRGEVSRFWSGEISEEELYYYEEKNRFENAYISMPHPFRQGDIVKDMVTGDIGIVICDKTDEDWESYDKKMKQSEFSDYSDVMVTVEFLYEESCFSHRHINPMRLEFYDASETNKKNKLLQSASYLINGYGSLECFQIFCEENAKGEAQEKKRWE